MNIKGSFFPPFFSPLAPHGSVHSLGLLFRPDKQGFFLFMAIIAWGLFRMWLDCQWGGRQGGRGDVMRGNFRPTTGAHSAAAPGNICHGYGCCYMWKFYTLYKYTCSCLASFDCLLSTVAGWFYCTVWFIFEEHMCELVHRIFDNCGNMVCEVYRKWLNISVYVKYIFIMTTFIMPKGISEAHCPLKLQVWSITTKSLVSWDHNSQWHRGVEIPHNMEFSSSYR